MNFLLRARHWHIFLVIFVLPMILYGFMIANVFASLATNPNQPDPKAIFSGLAFVPLLLIVVIGTVLSWQWSIAIGLQRYLPPTVRMKTTLFKVFFFIPLAYFLFICAFMMTIFSNGGLFASLNSTNPAEPPVGLFVGMAFIFPLHFFSIFCMFYIVYFSAKTLKSVELQREASFSDFVGEFFLILFNFIGVWFIQPRVNKIYENDGPTHDLADEYVPPVTL